MALKIVQRILRGDTRIQLVDFCYLALRMFLWARAIQAFGFMSGVLVIVIATIGFEKLICLVFKVHGLNTTDSNCWYDQKQNRLNVMASLFMERCDEKVFYDVFKSKLSQLDVRFRSRMVKILD
jgi:hypothetical protein